MRVPYAMRTMIDEIDKINPKAVGETRNPDGFGVWRTLLLDKATTEMLLDLLDGMTDPRIASRVLHSNGQYSLTFVGDRRGDDHQPFNLHKAYKVLTTVEENKPEEGRFGGPSREDRRRQLNKSTVAKLRQQYGYRATMKKNDILNDILHHEGY